MRPDLAPRRPRPRSPLTAALLCAALGTSGALLPACAESGGSSGGGTSGAVTPGGGTGSSSGTLTGPHGAITNTPQWQTAMAALALGPNPGPVDLEPVSTGVFNDLLARNWPHDLTLFQPILETELKKVVGQALQGVRILSVRSVTTDLREPPAIAVAGATQGGVRRMEVQAPRAPSAWSVAMGLDVGGVIPINVGGFQTSITIRMGVDVTVSDIRLRETADLDLRTPLAPTISAVGAPFVGMTLTLASQDPLLSTIASTLTQILDPVIRVALAGGSIYAQRQVGVALRTMRDDSAWGRGGPRLPPPTGLVDVEAFATTLSAKIQAVMAPFGQVYPTEYDQPDRGGNVVGWQHHGDSALWTGGCTAAEAMRFDATGDPRAEAAVTKLVDGIEILSEVVPAPMQGLLARAAIPLSSPHAAPLSAKDTSFVGNFRGTPHVGLGDTSRDSYTGTLFGLGQAYHRVPSARAKAAGIVDTLFAHLEAKDFAVYQAPGQRNNPSPGVPRMSVTMIQSPGLILAWTTLAATTNPARWGGSRASYAPLSDFMWLPAFLSAREVHEAYFKFNLENMVLLTLTTLESEPARYRGYLRTQEMLRRTTESHQNPWLDAAQGAMVPGAGAALANDIRHQLERYTLRPRRGFSARNSQDPAIEKVLITIATPNATGAPSGPVSTQARTYLVSKYPIPVEKRPATAFLFSSAPFELDGWEDPKVENPGIDLLLPYWVSRCYGILTR